MLLILTCLILNLHCTGDKKTNIALHSRLKNMKTTQEHFPCTVNILFCINVMLKKIMTSFCCKITTLFREIVTFNVTGRP